MVLIFIPMLSDFTVQKHPKYTVRFKLTGYLNLLFEFPAYLKQQKSKTSAYIYCSAHYARAMTPLWLGVHSILYNIMWE